MRWRIAIRVGLWAAAIFVGVSLGLGQDQPQYPANAKTGPGGPGPQLLGELRQLRKAVGGSVLSGTVLEPAPDQADEEFEAGLRTVWAQEASAAGGDAPKLAPPVTFSTAKPFPPKLTKVQIVLMLRKHSAALDRISHEMEHLRRYHHADRLSKTATELRLLARQFDAEVDQGTSTAAQ